MRLLREGKGLTQEQAALQAGMTGSYWGYLERGERNPSLSVVSKIADVLQVKPEILLHERARDEEPDALVRLCSMLRGRDIRHVRFVEEVAVAYFRAIN